MHLPLTKLLIDPGEGYPPEYLHARIRGRRSRLVRDWRALVFGGSTESHAPGSGAASEGESSWASTKQEYRVLYTLMDRGMRRIFRPFFFYAELETFFFCLRHLCNPSRRSGILDEIFSHTLLAAAPVRMLKGARDLPEVAGVIEALLKGISPVFAGVGQKADDEYSERQMEREIAARALMLLSGAAVVPVLRAFFVRIIDFRNIRVLRQTLLNDEGSTPAFIPGGSIIEARLLRALANGSVSDVQKFVREAAGCRTFDPAVVGFDAGLSRAMTLSLKRGGADPLGTGFVLEYLWRSAVERTNLRILAHASGLAPETVLAELTL